jgi:secreted trypsin-like serine protease
MIRIVFLAAAAQLVLISAIDAKPKVRVSYPAGETRQQIQRSLNASKVIGGRPAKPGQFKWQVALLRSEETQPFDGFYCGGSLIAWKWVLTAAHCTFRGELNPMLASEINVYLGSVDFNGGQRAHVKNIVRHEAYDQDSQDNDVALLELDRAITNRAGLELLGIASENDRERMKTGYDSTVLGWGSTQSGTVPMAERTASQQLLYVDGIQFKSADECNRNYVTAKRDAYRERLKASHVPESEIISQSDKLFPPNTVLITNNMICAGTSSGSKDSCFGDSGGPLIVYAGDTPHQVGIVSWGPDEGCGITNQYGVYVNLLTYRKWVLDHVHQ